MDEQEHFECTRQNAKLTRGQCARSYRDSNKPEAQTPKAGLDRAMAYDRRRPCCRGCLVGAEHARGVVIEPAEQIVRVISAKPLPQPRLCPCGDPTRPHSPWCSQACAMKYRLDNQATPFHREDC